MKFVLLVEGETEAKVLPEFIKQWLDPQLPQKIKIKTHLQVGWSKLYKNYENLAVKHLDGPGNKEIIAVISLMDLFGPTFYPSDKESIKARYDWGKNELESKFENCKFFHFFAVHELEAWLLSDPGIFPSEVKNSIKKISKPETVNFDTPPAKLLDKLYLKHFNRKYNKIMDGVNLFKKLDPNIAYKKCPKLKEMLDKMLELAETKLS